MVVATIDDARADVLLHALADATRRDILRRSMEGTHSVSALAAVYPMSFAAVQKHVAVLERAGLVAKQPHGREQRVRTRIDTIRVAATVLDELEALWRARVHRIDELLARPDPDPSAAREGAP